MMAETGTIWAADESFKISQNKAAGSREYGASQCKRRLKLRQLDAKDVDAVFAEDLGTINSLRDVQVLRGLLLVPFRSSLCRSPVPTVA